MANASAPAAGAGSGDTPQAPAGPREGGPSLRAILRVILTVVATVLTLWVLWLLRTPISYVLIAVFIAVAASGPVNVAEPPHAEGASRSRSSTSGSSSRRSSSARS